VAVWYRITKSAIIHSLAMVGWPPRWPFGCQISVNLQSISFLSLLINLGIKERTLAGVGDMSMVEFPVFPTPPYESL